LSAAVQVMSKAYPPGSLCRRPRCVAYCRGRKPARLKGSSSAFVFTIGQTLPRFPASIGYARWVPTTPTGNLKWQYSMASAQILALGPFLFCADHLVLKFGIVLRKPRRCGLSVREDLKMIGVFDQFARIIGGSILRTDKRPRPTRRKTGGRGRPLPRG